MSMTTETPAKAKDDPSTLYYTGAKKGVIYEIHIADPADDGDYKYEAFDTEAKDDSAEEKERSAP